MRAGPEHRRDHEQVGLTGPGPAQVAGTMHRLCDDASGTVRAPAPPGDVHAAHRRQQRGGARTPCQQQQPVLPARAREFPRPLPAARIAVVPVDHAGAARQYRHDCAGVDAALFGAEEPQPGEAETFARIGRHGIFNLGDACAACRHLLACRTLAIRVDDYPGRGTRGRTGSRERFPGRRVERRGASVHRIPAGCGTPGVRREPRPGNAGQVAPSARALPGGGTPVRRTPAVQQGRGCGAAGARDRERRPGIRCPCAGAQHRDSRPVRAAAGAGQRRRGTPERRLPAGRRRPVHRMVPGRSGVGSGRDHGHSTAGR